MSAPYGSWEHFRLLHETILQELAHLWADFGCALNRAVHTELRLIKSTSDPSTWSLEMKQICDRIGTLTKLVGSPKWEDVPVILILQGWWRAVHEKEQLPVPPVPDALAEDHNKRTWRPS